MRYPFKTSSDSDQPEWIYKLQIQLYLQIQIDSFIIALNQSTFLLSECGYIYQKLQRSSMKFIQKNIKKSNYYNNPIYSRHTPLNEELGDGRDRGRGFAADKH